MGNLKYISNSLILERKNKHLKQLKENQISDAELNRWSKFYDKLLDKYGKLEGVY